VTSAGRQESQAASDDFLVGRFEPEAIRHLASWHLPRLLRTAAINVKKVAEMFGYLVVDGRPPTPEKEWKCWVIWTMIAGELATSDPRNSLLPVSQPPVY
jgi:hypothetical protein